MNHEHFRVFCIRMRAGIAHGRDIVVIDIKRLIERKVGKFLIIVFISIFPILIERELVFHGHFVPFAFRIFIGKRFCAA